jgi:methionine-rich copper-binding protein CopC
MLSSTRSTRARSAALVCGVLITLTLALLSHDAGAHAFVSRTEPRSGATLAETPAAVRIWFDGPVEPLFIDIRVEDGAKRRVDRGDGRRSQSDNTLVEVGLTALTPGRYRVFWSVIARDGLARVGSFSFLLK